MKRNFEALSKSSFDLAVIGGGVNGAAIAREAALRGWKVALIEARDFASGTSSRSSKLIHGGLRYLEQGSFRLVREARKERRLLTRLASHLVRPVPFLLPIYRGDPYSPSKIRLGLAIYDWMGNLGPQDRRQFYSSTQTLERVPALRSDGLRASAVYYDSETDDARFTLELVLDAERLGAAVANYALVRKFSIVRGNIAAAEIEDTTRGTKGELAARFWVNAAGPWVDAVRSLVPGFDGSNTIRMTKGTHLILPPLSDHFALFAAIRPGDRVLLAMPWHGCTLLGTTDTDYEGDPGAVQPGHAELEYLLNAINRILREPLTPEDVGGSFAGIRALVLEPDRSPSANTREHRFHRDPWATNMIAVCGGKLTAARALGEKLVDLIAPEVAAGVPGRVSHPSRFRLLPGGDTGPFEEFIRRSVTEATEKLGVKPEVAARIAGTYGSRWKAVLDPVREKPSLADPLPGPTGILPAEIHFAIQEEMTLTLEDFLLRRSGLSWTTQRDTRLATAAAEVFGSELGWSAPERARALERFGITAGLRSSAGMM